ncbi:hypothetical protein [Mailhella sp.]
MNWNFGFFDVDTLKRAAQAVGIGAGASALSPQEAEGAVYSKDGRRLLNLLDNASKGALSVTEPVFEFQERLPKEVFASANANGGELKTRSFAAARNDIQHYWNERHKHMTNPQIEDMVESVVEGQNRFYAKGNEPYPQSIAALGSGKTGARGSLRPAEDYTFLHQVNPLSNKRLLKQKSLSEMPDGSAGHPLAHTSTGEGPTQRAISADSISHQTIADSAVPDKLKLPAAGLTVGLGSGLALPEGAQAAGRGRENGEPSLFSSLARQAALGTRGVLEGVGSGLTLGLGDPGRGLSDLLGLPVPQNETEQGRVGLNRSLAGVAGTGLLGAGLAKAPGAAVSAVGRALSSDPVAEAMLTLGDENFGKMLEKGNEIMGLLEQYEHDFGEEEFF